MMRMVPVTTPRRSRANPRIHTTVSVSSETGVGTSGSEREEIYRVTGHCVSMGRIVRIFGNAQDRLWKERSQLLDNFPCGKQSCDKEGKGHKEGQRGFGIELEGRHNCGI
jgi:hypothetical protein